MSGNRKYANLPDLDQAPEIYETLEDVESATTVQAESSSSRESSSGSSDDETSRIERSRIDTDSARSRFDSSRVDANGANFSDQVGRHRRSYHVYTSRREEEDDEELDPEQRLKRPNLSKRIVRMQQLLEDLKQDIEVAKDKGEWKDGVQEEDDEKDNAALTRISESMKHLTAIDRGPDSASTRMKRRAAMKREATIPKMRSDLVPSGPPALSELSQDYAQISDPQAMAIFTKVSSRLDTLEKLLGLDSLPPSDLPSVKDYPMPLIKMTDVMAKQMNLINDVGEPYLDQLAKKINTVTSNAERMEEKRKEAKKDYESLIAARESSIANYNAGNAFTGSARSPTLSGTTRMPGENDARSSQVDATNPLMDPELPSKISALHSTLPAVERLAPLLHPTLERLRALREVHQDSASAHVRLTELEQHEVEIQKQLKQWRETLGELEEQTTELEEEWLENMENFEKKVINLESRISEL